MRVDEAFRQRRMHAGIEPEHRARTRKIPERVDDEPSAARNKARVAPAESAIRLQAREDLRRELVQLHVIGVRRTIRRGEQTVHPAARAGGNDTDRRARGFR